MGSSGRGSRWSAAVAVIAVTALLVSGCGGDDGGDDEASVPTSQAPDADGSGGSSADDSSGSGAGSADGTGPAPDVSPEPLGAPFVAELPWGDFALADHIADKLADGAQLNFVLSAAATGAGGSGELMGAGWVEAGAGVDADVNARLIGPNSADRAAQIETIDSLISAGSIDCLAVEVDDPASFMEIIDRAVDAGIPTFTVGGDSADSKRFAFYGLDDRATGKLVGTTVGEWAANNRILVRKAAVLTGDVDNPRFVARMQGFIEGLLEIHSGIEFVNGPDNNIESWGFDPEAVYAAADAWMSENLDVDVIFHSDSGMTQVAEMIADRSLYGDVYTSGFHMSEHLANYIRDGVVVAAVAQQLSVQAANAAEACGDFLVDGDHETGHVVQQPLIAARDNVETLNWALPENQ